MSPVRDEESATGGTTPEALAEKIPDGDLRGLADDPTEETTSVIIELELPQRKVEFTTHRRGDREVARPVRVAAAAGDEIEAVDRTTTEAMRFLHELLGEAPVHLRSARAFVAKVRGDHLHKIAGQPWARCIRRNRPLR